MNGNESAADCTGDTAEYLDRPYGLEDYQAALEAVRSELVTNPLACPRLSIHFPVIIAVLRSIVGALEQAAAAEASRKTTVPPGQQRG